MIKNMGRISLIQLRMDIIQEVEEIVDEKVHEIVNKWATDLADEMVADILNPTYNEAYKIFDEWSKTIINEYEVEKKSFESFQNSIKNEL